jgi:hypothetical protein
MASQAPTKPRKPEAVSDPLADLVPDAVTVKDSAMVTAPDVFRYDGGLWTADGQKYDGDEDTVPLLDITSLPDVQKRPSTPEPIIDLDEQSQEPPVRFQGKLYYLKDRHDIGPVEEHQLRLDGAEFQRYYMSDEALTETEQQRFDLLLDSLFDRVLVAPKNIKKLIKPGNKARVVVHFIFAPLLRAAQAQQAAEQIQQTPKPGDDSTTAS